MAQVINTNVSSLFAGATLNKSSDMLKTSMARLSSGVRINSSKDDVTGLKIAVNYDTNVKGINVAIRNSNDAVSQAQILDGYGQQITENLQRLYEIYVQTGDQATTESTALLAENARIATLSSNVALIGANITVDGSGGTVAATSTAITDPSGATTAAATLTAITTLMGERANFGADMATFSSAVSTMQIESVNVSAAYSRIMDTDYAAETASLARNNILQQAGTAMLAQANQTPQSVMTLLR